MRSGAREAVSEDWQLIHDDPFANASTDEQVADVIASFSLRMPSPYTEALRRLLGTEETSEAKAHARFAAILEHRRALSTTLGRPIHLRVAALDLLTSPQSEPVAPRETPVLVTRSLLARAFEEATADGVTGLPQRAQFMSVLRHELRQRKRRNVCVVYIDLDRFKAVNDTHGHARGDEVLSALARSVRGALREGDVLARVGGDEFAVLLVDVTPAEAEAAVGRLRARFETLTAAVGTSFSAGLALARPGEDAESLVMRADQQMFRQKRLRSSSTPLAARDILSR